MSRDAKNTIISESNPEMIVGWASLPSFQLLFLLSGSYYKLFRDSILVVRPARHFRPAPA